jgi:hypothetical protein
MTDVGTKVEYVWCVCLKLATPQWSGGVNEKKKIGEKFVFRLKNDSEES